MLENAKQWLKEQERILTGRVAQGVIRYKTMRRKAESLQNSPNKYEEVVAP